jgi:hypothetical protein
MQEKFSGGKKFFRRRRAAVPQGQIARCHSSPERARLMTITVFCWRLGGVA